MLALPNGALYSVKGPNVPRTAHGSGEARASSPALLGQGCPGLGVFQRLWAGGEGR